jgi:hypothetical protein
MLPAADLAAPQPLPVCPEHPERPSVAPCERCGRFLCQECAVSLRPPRCAACHARVGDPLGVLAQPFAVDRALANGWKLLSGALPRIVPICLLFGVPGGLLTYLVESNTDELKTSLRISSFFDGTIGLIAVGAHLALMVGVAEGRLPSVGEALREGLRAWPRLFGARFRSGLIIFLFALLLLVPGIIKAVTLALVTEAAFREPGSDALATSTRLVTGRRWELFGLLLACNALVFIAALPLGIITGLLSEAFPAITPGVEILLDASTRVVDTFSSAVGLSAFYGFKRLHGEELEPR